MFTDLNSVYLTNIRQNTP